MKNHLFFKYRSKMLLKIEGKNIERFLKRLISNHIELLKITHHNYKCVSILIYKEDYDKVMELKSIYDVTLEDIYGIIKIRKVIKGYRYILGFSIVAVALLIFLSNVIFNIDVIHTDSKTRDFLKKELQGYGIEPYRFKKSFQEIQNIKNDLLERYKDSIEWLEIEEKGTTYIVRLQERILPNTDKDTAKQDVIAKKGAILKRIVSRSGETVKEINQYVNPGDVVISGTITLYDNIKDTVRAEGDIYGEVWYNVTVEYPYIYGEIKETGNEKNVYALKILSQTKEFTFSPYVEKRVEEQILLSHPLLPLSFVKQKQKELITISEILTEEQAIDKAIEKASQKIEESMKEEEKILSYHILSTKIEEDKVVLEVFYSVFENITDYRPIEEVGENVP